MSQWYAAPLSKCELPGSLKRPGYFAPSDNDDLIALESLLKLCIPHHVEVTLPPLGVMMIVAGSDGFKFQVVLTQMEDPPGALLAHRMN